MWSRDVGDGQRPIAFKGAWPVLAATVGDFHLLPGGIMLRASSLSRRWHSINLLNTGNLSPSGSQLILYLCFLFIKLSYST